MSHYFGGCTGPLLSWELFAKVGLEKHDDFTTVPHGMAVR